MTKCVLVIFGIVMLSNYSFCYFGPEEPPYPLEKILADADNIIIGEIEVLSCEEPILPETLEDLQNKPGLRKYVIKVLPLTSIKGNIVVKTPISKDQKMVTIHFNAFPSSYLCYQKMRVPKESPFLSICPGRLYIFILKHKSEETYDLVDNRGSIIPCVLPTEDEMKRNTWDYILLTLKDHHLILDAHDDLYQFLIESDISEEKKKEVKKIHEEYINKKILEMKNDINGL